MSVPILPDFVIFVLRLAFLWWCVNKKLPYVLAGAKLGIASLLLLRSVVFFVLFGRFFGRFFVPGTYYYASVLGQGDHYTIDVSATIASVLTLGGYQGGT